METPTYFGALQAFSPMEPEVVAVGSDADGIEVDDLVHQARIARPCWEPVVIKTWSARTAQGRPAATISRSGS